MSEWWSEIFGGVFSSPSSPDMARSSSHDFCLGPSEKSPAGGVVEENAGGSLKNRSPRIPSDHQARTESNRHASEKLVEAKQKKRSEADNKPKNHQELHILTDKPFKNKPDSLCFTPRTSSGSSNPDGPQSPTYVFQEVEPWEIALVSPPAF